jgi:hypothetical protein
MNTTVNGSLLNFTVAPVLHTETPRHFRVAATVSYNGAELFALALLFVLMSISVVSFVIWLLFRNRRAEDGDDTIEQREAAQSSVAVATMEKPPAASVEPAAGEEDTVASSGTMSDARRKFRESRLLLSKQQTTYGTTNARR